MTAFVYHGAGRSAWEDVPDPAVKDGIVPGHEAVGG